MLALLALALAATWLAASVSSACLAALCCSDICPLLHGLEPVPKFPKQGVITQRHPAVQVGGAGRAARPRLGPDLPLNHLHVPGPPQRRDLVVVEQALSELPEIVVTSPVPGHDQQRVPDLDVIADREPAAAEQTKEGVPQRGLGEAAGQIGR